MEYHLGDMHLCLDVLKVLLITTKVNLIVDKLFKFLLICILLVGAYEDNIGLLLSSL